MIKVLSLGWGVQSFTMAAMVALGKLPMVDYAIHADTGWERSSTYEFAKKWTPWLVDHGVNVVTVKSDMAGMVFDKYGAIPIPVYTSRLTGEDSGTMHRQCTGLWKINPVKKFIREINDDAQQWLGISLDEITRIKPSGVRYITNVYPLIDMLERPHTRSMCANWLLENGLDIPSKSACVFCPYQNRVEWRVLKAIEQDWNIVKKVDGEIRNAREGYVSYLTSNRIPIDQCDFSNQEDNGQLNLFEMEECSGNCFL